MKHAGIICLALLAAGAACAGEPSARDLMVQGVGHFFGVNGKVDNQQAGRLLAEAAEKGDPVAKMWTAVLHFYGGCGIRKDVERARLMADGRHRQIGNRGKVAHAQLLGDQEGVQNLQSGGI